MLHCTSQRILFQHSDSLWTSNTPNEIWNATGARCWPGNYPILIAVFTSFTYQNIFELLSARAHDSSIDSHDFLLCKTICFQCATAELNIETWRFSLFSFLPSKLVAVMIITIFTVHKNLLSPTRNLWTGLYVS